MKIFIGGDHRGFVLKESLKPYLISLGHDVVDCGPFSYIKTDDFTDFTFTVGDNVAKGQGSYMGQPGSLLSVAGVVICGSAGGVTIAANRVRGIRCVAGWHAADVRHNREHDDLNLIAFSSDNQTEEQVKECLNVFLTTPFLGEERHIRRLLKIQERDI